jgi:hypothetical protein
VPDRPPRPTALRSAADNRADPATIAGILAGIGVMYLTGLLITA